MSQETFDPIQEELPGGRLSHWLQPRHDTLLSPSLAGPLCGVSVMCIHRWLDRGVLSNAAPPGHRRRVRLADLERITGKKFTLVDLHEAERRRGEYLARQYQSPSRRDC
jgi:hypothetical protein